MVSLWLCRLPTCGFVPTAAPAAGPPVKNSAPLAGVSYLQTAAEGKQRAKNSALLRVAEAAWGWDKEHEALRVPAGHFESTTPFLPMCLPPSVGVLRVPECSPGDPRGVCGQDDSWINELTETELRLTLLWGGRSCFSGIETVRWKGPGIRGKGERVSCSVMQFLGGGNTSHPVVF